MLGDWRAAPERADEEEEEGGESGLRPARRTCERVRVDARAVETAMASFRSGAAASRAARC